MNEDDDRLRLEAPAPLDDLAAMYLDLMKRCLTRTGFREVHRRVHVSPKRWLVWPFYAATAFSLSRFGIEMLERRPFDPTERTRGLDRPADAETMIGLRRLDDLQARVEDVLRRGVAGDLVETGVWRGGAAIFMRAILAAHGDRTRRVWAADSFRGLPRPDAARYPADAGDLHWALPELAVSLDEVKANFARYGLLDERVHFLEGWFKDTLPAAPIERIAVLRLDGDLYESTIDALSALYPRLSVGGYAVVDDYGAVAACARAVEDYRREHGIVEPIQEIDGIGVYWRRER
jgi:O-methyltransferase